MAAEKVREVLLEIAGEEIQVHPEELEPEDGEIRVKGSPDQSTVNDVASETTYARGTLIVASEARIRVSDG